MSEILMNGPGLAAQTFDLSPLEAYAGDSQVNYVAPTTNVYNAAQLMDDVQ